MEFRACYQYINIYSQENRKIEHHGSEKKVKHTLSKKNIYSYIGMYNIDMELVKMITCFRYKGRITKISNFK